MSTNHFSSDLPETHWWSQQPQPPIMDNDTPSSKHHYLPEFYHHHHHHQAYYNSSTMNNTLNFNLNHEDNNDEELDEQQQDELQQQGGGGSREILLDKEPMFEKPLTPSDVGKLNRLVIPKQHAEKYFPLGGGDSVDKGLLLSFEDESGKFWRFRYSYWNSSQSYVLTKGWSRYVKDKRLDAGDVVLFERHRTDTERLFIGWRRRAAPDSGGAVAQVNGGGGESGGWTRMLYSAHPYPTHPHHHHHHHHAVPYQPDSLHAGILFTF